MNRHLDPRQIEQFARGELAPSELLQADDHLAVCERCRRTLTAHLESDPRTSQAIAALARHLRTADSHPDFELLMAFVDGRLESEEQRHLESHFEHCPDCSAERDDLLAFRAGPSFQHSPAPASVEATHESWSQRLRGALSDLLEPRLAFALATVVVISIGATLLLLRNQPEASSAAVLASVDDVGGRITLHEDGTLSGLTFLDPAEEEATRAVLAGEPLTLPVSTEIPVGRHGTLMGPTDSPQQLEPLAPLATVVSALRPTLSWTRLEGARHYVVSIYDSRLERVAISEPLIGHSARLEWQPETPLAAGQSYSWQVVAVHDGGRVIAPAPPAPEARFRILDEEDRRSLSEARRAYRSSALVSAIVALRYGLLDEAESDFERVLESDLDSTLAPRLLEELRVWRSSRVPSDP